LSKISQEEEEKQEGKKRESVERGSLQGELDLRNVNQEREREREGWFLTLCYSLFIDYLLFLPVVSKVPKER
jgi:hypothetical protein